MAKNWMSGAVKHKGALRATAKRMGMIHGDEPLSMSMVEKLKKSKNPQTRKRATLAETFMNSRH